MEAMHREFRDIAEFFVIYINEAHPRHADDQPVAVVPGVDNHRTYGDRCAAADRYLDETLLSIPCLIDDLNNSTDLAYRAWPDKVFLINGQGTIAIAGADGPYGFVPALEEAHDWLSEFRETGQEPVVVAGKAPDFGTVLLGQSRPDGPQAEYLAKLEQAQRQMVERRAATAKDRSPPPNAGAKTANIAESELSASDSPALPARPYVFYALTAISVALVLLILVRLCKS